MPAQPAGRRCTSSPAGKIPEVLGRNAPVVQEQNGKFRPRYPLGEAEIGPERNRSMSQRRASRRREAPRSRTLRGKRRSGGRLTLAPCSTGAEPLQRYGLRFLLATLYNYRGHAAVALGNRRGSDERARGAALPAHRPACAGGEQSMKRAEKLPFFDCAYSTAQGRRRLVDACFMLASVSQRHAGSSSGNCRKLQEERCTCTVWTSLCH